MTVLFTSDGAPNGVGSLKFKFNGFVPFLNMLGVIGFVSLWLPVDLVCEPGKMVGRNGGLG